MVRLRSNRWYSADAQGRARRRVATQVNGTRRLVSLCILLALVMLMLQKARDPRYISNAFTALGVPLEPEDEGQLLQLASERVTGDSRGADQRNSGANDSDPDQRLTSWEATCEDLVPRLFSTATEAELAAMADSFFDLSNNASGKELASLRTRTVQQLDAISEQLAESPLTDSERSSWLELLDRFRSEWQRLLEQLAERARGENESPQRSVTPSEAAEPFAAAEPMEALTGVSPELYEAAARELDRWLLESLRDAAPWRKSEQLAFWRLLLKRAVAERGAASVTPPLVSTRQLESATDVYRGREVRFRGTVRRVQQVVRSSSVLGGPSDYWLLWLRGADEALQPVAVYSVEPAVQEIARAQDADEDAFPFIEVTALVGKRLAYGSEAGVQVAPTLFASQLHWRTPSAEVTTAALPSVTSQRILVAFGVGLLLAIAILLPILAQWKRVVRRPSAARKLRNVTRLLLAAAVLPSVMTAELSTAEAQQRPRQFALQASESQTPSTRLPWADPAAGEAWALLTGRLQEVVAAPDLVQLESFLQGETAELGDGTLRLMHLLGRLGWGRLSELQEVIELPRADARLRPIRVEGTVHGVQPSPLTDAQQAWFLADDSQQLYRVELSLAEAAVGSHEASTGNSQRAVVFCRRVPSAWLTAAQLRQSVAFDAVALEKESDRSHLCYFAELPEWRFSDDVRRSSLLPAIDDHLWRLGSSGWNLAWLDAVREGNGKRIERDESHAFFALLRVANEKYPRASIVDGLSDPLQMLDKPQQSVGKPLRWRVRLVSGAVVQIDDPRSAERLGSDRYYQLDGFVDIGARQIRYQVGEPTQPREIVFEREFPVTIVTAETSQYVPREAVLGEQLNWQIGRYVELDGLFYRLWSYQSDLVSSQRQAARQIAPLVVALELSESAPPPRRAEPVGWFGYALCGTTLAFLGAILWLASQNDRRPRRRY